MGERKGVNKYYPPDFDPKKHKSLNGYHGTHALRERARKLNQGILIIRFEMPYNIWCDGCGNHIGMGVRYNAEKKKIGNYYTTPIWRFRMKCHLCDNHIEMDTDPKNLDYVIFSGARKKNQKWDPTDNEQIAPEDHETVKKLATDPMYKLEHGTDDKEKATAIMPTLAELEDVQHTWKEDYIVNKMLRNKFRKEKKETKASEDVDKELLAKGSLDIKLVPEHDEDKRLASLMKYSIVQSFDEKRKEKRSEIKERPLFLSPSSKTDTKEEKLRATKKKLGLSSARTSSSSSSSSRAARTDIATSSQSAKLSNTALGIVKKNSGGGGSTISSTATFTPQLNSQPVSRETPGSSTLNSSLVSCDYGSSSSSDNE